MSGQPYTMRGVDTLFQFPDINGPFRGSHAVSAEWLTPRQLRSALLTRLFRDVYIPRAIEITHELRCVGASLITSENAVLTGCSAVTVRGFYLAAPNDRVEFVVPEASKFVAQRGLDVRRTEVTAAESEPWRSIRIATPLRATMDLLTNTRMRPSLPRTVGLLDILLRAGFIDRQELEVLLAARHDSGIVRAREALALADPRAESIPESEVRVWLTRAGLAPSVQVVVYDRRGRFLGRLDLGYEGAQVAVEYDGDWHRAGDQPRLDHHRRMLMRAEGWEFVVVTKEMLYGDPEGMIALVRDALRRRNAIVDVSTRGPGRGCPARHSGRRNAA